MVSSGDKITLLVVLHVIFFLVFTGGELLKYTYTLFGGNYCLNGQKTKSGRAFAPGRKIFFFVKKIFS